ncbi:MAG: hypothetical protein ABSF09_14300 [Candidatus Bathyarchaeia archaeon]|jgi:hypothetical protein
MEKNWRELFTVQEVDNYQLKTETIGECNANCLDAKELKCTCKCAGKNPGSHLKACLKPLDTYVERICEYCKGEGCPSCNQTGAVEIQVTAKEFYQGGE